MNVENLPQYQCGIEPLSIDPVPIARTATSDARRRYPNVNILPEVIEKTILSLPAGDLAKALAINAAHKIASERDSQSNLDQALLKKL